MVRYRIREWIAKWKNHNHTDCAESEPTIENETNLKYDFSPMTYQNPCIFCIHPILERVLEKRKITYQQLELVVIDAEMDQDDYDIQIVLSQLTHMLNYLLLVTDRPAYYQGFMDTMYEENGLIVQQLSKADSKCARGNLVLDFERSGNISAESMIRPGTVYLPIYKKQWEISENLDIMVPVGYNTLVVDGIRLPQPEVLWNDKLDRLDQEFRKG